MKIIAFIVSEREVKKILKHIGEETIRPPPLIQPPAQSDDWDSVIEDYMPAGEYEAC